MKRAAAAMFICLLAATMALPAVAAEPADSKEVKTGKPKKTYSFKLSGYFKADYAYNDARIRSGNFALYVLEGSKDNQTSITAREMRFGVDFSWEEEKYITDAKLEFDFYGLGVEPLTINSMENRATNMLRHAYVRLTRGHWSFLAGQTSDVISPLVPKTVNYTVGWTQGNIGYRRPQFRFTAWSDLGDVGSFKADIAAARTIGGDIDGDGFDDGADANSPTFQGRIGFDRTFDNGGKLALGVSGHYGIEKHGSSDINKTKSNSGNLDLAIKFNKYVVLAGELFVGQALGQYLGGIGQSYSPTGNEIGAKGGWGMVSLLPTEKIRFNFGYAVDDPDRADFILPEEDGDWSFIDWNSLVFGNIMYGITSNVQAMLEVSYLETEYRNYLRDTGTLYSSHDLYDALRIQFAIKAGI
jgi:hypothetical protein